MNSGTRRKAEENTPLAIKRQISGEKHEPNMRSSNQLINIKEDNLSKDPSKELNR